MGKNLWKECDLIMKKLFEYESDYYYAYNRAINWASSSAGCSIKNLVEDIGFNNITILNPNEEDTDTKDIEVYFGSDTYDNMSDKAKNCMVVLSSIYQDFDDYTCVNVCLKNEDDWKYFEGLL